MKLAKYVKQSTERKRYVVDYTDWLDTGETLTLASLAVSPATTPPLVVDASAIGTDNKTVVYFVNGGLDGRTYTITLTATTSVGQVKEDEITFSIRDT